MKLSYRIILIISFLFIGSIFFWAIFSPKEDISTRINQTIKEQEKVADLSFKDVTFEEIVTGIKYWQLQANSAMINKSTEVATLKTVKGTFFEKGQAALKFISPAALWDMKKKEIFLDTALGYDVKLENKINSILDQPGKLVLSIFNLTKDSSSYWFQAKNLSWKLATKKLLCSGGIVLNKGEITSHAEKLESDVGLKRIKLEGKPRVIISPQTLSPITIEAKSFEVLNKENTITAQGSPKITWNTATIFADQITYYQETSTLKLAGRVRIDYNDIKAWGNTANYQTETEKIILKGAATAKQGENKLSGEEVMVELAGKKISVIGSGKIVISEEELQK
ncbi:MAG: LptA/OstA family protein [bacterium]|nr:hypothetical protein [Candidatus Margulisiibacteriota bacterium]